MPTLDWIGKKAVINHHREVPYHLLKCDADLSAGDTDSGNLLVQGDNLLALKALLPYYAGQVKCIYIDPPYNTGVDERTPDGKRSGWIYNDNVNSPEIRKWLHRVVGAEAEDLSRHDKWLCMMYPRITLLREFLREDGVIFVSIDENEVSALRFLLDELFASSNRLGTIVWKNVTDNNPTRIAVEHEYVLCYARSTRALEKEWKSTVSASKAALLKIGAELTARHKGSELQAAYTSWFLENRSFLGPMDRYKYIDEGGVYTGSQSVHNPGREGYRYDVPHPVTGKPCREPLMGYRFPPETMQRLLSEGRILFGMDESKIIELKVYASEFRAKLSSVFELDGRIGTNELKAIFPDDKRPFDFPKPTALIEELLSFTTTGIDLVMDSFAGSGTTGQAVLQLNRADKQNRRFILVEMKEDIARTITSKRLRRVCEGYSGLKGEHQDGLGGGFRYCTLGTPLFDEQGNISDGVTFENLAAHVYFAETGQPLPPAPVEGRTPLLGIYKDVAVYLLFNGILGDRSVAGGNVLTGAILSDLPLHDGPKVIYGEGTRLGLERRRREGIVFKQIPYDIELG
jgi:adenine-specific DNA-methyltransferase